MKKDEDVSHVEQKEKETLDEVLDSTYPLLRKFREACPGSFKHSQSLAAMVESVAMSLDLDVDFMRAASLYHDVGKMNNPDYFTENQLENDDDPHKDLDPWVSYQIISRHVSDSVNILINDEKFPRKLIEVISQHHGTSVVQYFFDKADSDLEDLYRYKGTKPTCIESALLMIADCVEATSRSLVQSGKYDAVDVVDSTVNRLLSDEQLNEVYCKLGDLNKIKEGLVKELKSMYVKRVDYDEVKKERKNGKNGSVEKEVNKNG